ncbi:glycosyltransferase family 4 protein [uncultured Paraglaciecola sp.]|uniref:glycosyltransferase family 4 protein n=1 Tax=uncultured Paraglaciecola sp. TaxID=1765024 RepID=UPI002594A858|nr:glycosyltransferase family 4 protein [uncultured Paraglaciecola sp.]
MASAGKKKKILIIVENLPSPFDRRVWQEATTLVDNGHQVSIICPTGKGYDKKYEVIDGIHIYRHNLPFEADGALGYLAEYSVALFWEFYLSFKVLFTRGFDVIHGCNPPDLIFLVGGFFKLFGKKFVFDHHDINPELYEAKFDRRDIFYKMMVLFEKLTFKTANMSIATNESYKKIAIERGGMNSDKVHIIRSGPKLDRLKIIPPVEALKKGKDYLVGYVGVIGKQEGVDHLLRAVSYIVTEQKRHDVHFIIVGSGTELDALKKYAKELSIEDYVTFTGRVPDQDLLESLNTADVCVNPDIANEMNDKSTMNKIMEYMALAKPIVQYDLIEGRFSAQKASLYAEKNNEKDLADKILYLLDNPELRKEMGEFGRNRVVNELEWEYEAPKLIAAYDSL